MAQNTNFFHLKKPITFAVKGLCGSLPEIPAFAGMTAG